MAEKELTFSEVSSHSSKKDLYMVIHEKVYNASSFIDEHPGGEEVLLDVAGQDATEAFEDVGHSDEAREILAGLLVGNLKRGDGDPERKSTIEQSQANTASTSVIGGPLYVMLALGALLAAAVYYTTLGN